MTTDTDSSRGEDAAFFADQQRRRAELRDRISMFCDHINLPGDDGDAAYDLLREAAARISSDRLRFERLATPQEPALDLHTQSGLAEELAAAKAGWDAALTYWGLCDWELEMHVEERDRILTALGRTEA